MEFEQFVTTEQAARLLNVSPQHVRRLTETGELTKLARGLVDRSSIDRYLAERPMSRTRTWAQHTAWAAVAMLSGSPVYWLGPTQSSRLRATLRELVNPDDLVVRTRDRAKVRTFSSHTAAVPRLRAILASPDLTRLGLVPAIGDQAGVDGYLAADHLDDVVSSWGLREDPGGQITIRITDFPFEVVSDLTETSTVLAALDASTSLDPRVRGAGSRALAAALEAFR